MSIAFHFNRSLTPNTWGHFQLLEQIGVCVYVCVRDITVVQYFEYQSIIAGVEDQHVFNVLWCIIHDTIMVDGQEACIARRRGAK